MIAVASEMVPEGWRVAPLGEVCRTTSGGTPSRRNDAHFKGDIPWVKSGELPDGIVHDIEESITQGAIDNSSAKLFPVGTLLIALYGATVGKLGVLPHAAATNQAVCAIFPDDDLDQKYLFWFLRYARSDLLNQAIGGAQTNISQEILRNLQVPIAPLAQQIRIVAEIEKQLSRLDEAVASLKRVKANLKCYQAAVLKAAVEGKLTEEWRKQNPDVEPAGKLLERILAERRTKWEEAELAKMKAKGKEPKDDKWKEKYKTIEPPINAQTFKLPALWAWTNLGEVSWSVKDGPHYSPKYAEKGIPFISGGNIRPDGIDFSSTKFISEELHEELSARCKPRVGDLLYTKGGTTGIAHFNIETRDFNVWVHVAIIRLLQGIDGRFLQNAMNSSHCYRQSQLYTHGVGNQDLGLTRMIKITLPLPPIEEQEQINIELDQRMSVARGLENHINDDIKRAERTRQSILGAAFRRVLQ